MSDTNLPALKYCFSIRGRHGTPCGFGALWYGKSRLGEYDPLTGIYQRYPAKKGKRIRKLKHYITTHAPSPAEQASRNKFAQAVAGWKLLTNEQKDYYNKLTYPKHQNGITRYIRAFILDRL
jgi:hypothetical protein